VGRADDLAGLADRPGVHVVVGNGGIGKTWLAVHWAHTNEHRFPDGQLFVDLRGFSPDQPMVPAAAIRGFLDALGAVDIPPDPHAQVALYRSLTADKRLLVVLDNAADAAQAETLLPGGASCTVLVTSRRQLTSLNTRHGAGHLRLGVLRDTESHDLLAARLGDVRMAADPAAVERIVTYCAGLPLALAIVASRGEMSPELPLARIADELGRLDDEDPADSVPAALSWSLRALTGTQVRVLGLLAAAPGPDIGLAALLSLTGSASELPALERLCLLERTVRPAPGVIPLRPRQPPRGLSGRSTVSPKYPHSMSRPVTRASFKHALLPIADPRELPAPQRLWTDSEWERIKLGLQEKDMDDKWVALVEGDQLSIHRAGGGQCVYDAVFTPCEGGYRITTARTGRGRDDRSELHSAFLELLITGHILHSSDNDLWARFTALGGIRALFGA